MWEVHLYTSLGEMKWPADTEPTFHCLAGTANTSSAVSWHYKGNKTTLLVGSTHSVAITKIS